MSVSHYVAIMTTMIALFLTYPAAGQIVERDPYGPLPAEIAEPVYSFTQVRKRFLRDDVPTTGTLSQADADGLRATGYSGPELDESNGKEFFFQRSTVTIEPDADGDLIFKRMMPLKGPDGEEYLGALKPLKVPIITDPYAAINPLSSMHPLAFIVRDLQRIIGIREIPAIITGVTERQTRIQQGTWVYMYNRDPETGEITDISQHLGKTGEIVMRMAFEDWHYSPSGRYIPRNVYYRTFLMDESVPITELQFLNISEEGRIKKE